MKGEIFWNEVRGKANFTQKNLIFGIDQWLYQCTPSYLMTSGHTNKVQPPCRHRNRSAMGHVTQCHTHMMLDGTLWALPYVWDHISSSPPLLSPLHSPPPCITNPQPKGTSQASLHRRALRKIKPWNMLEVTYWCKIGPHPSACPIPMNQMHTSTQTGICIISLTD